MGSELRLLGFWKKTLIQYQFYLKEIGWLVEQLTYAVGVGEEKRTIFFHDLLHREEGQNHVIDWLDFKGVYSAVSEK